MVSFAMFIETFSRGKITKVTYGYFAFMMYFIITMQFFPAHQYREDFAIVVNIADICFYFYIFLYDIVYFYFIDKKGPRGKRRDSTTIAILAGATVMFIGDIY
jgi:hypothetical protein